MERIRFITGTETQAELADLLGVRQSFISDAKRRGKIPSSWLEAYSWPGNVREMQNVMERYSLAWQRNRADETSIQPFLAPQAEWTSLDGPVSQGFLLPDSAPVLSEREKILQALREHGGHKGNTARALGINRTTLYHKMNRLGLQ